MVTVSPDTAVVTDPEPANFKVSPCPMLMPVESSPTMPVVPACNSRKLESISANDSLLPLFSVSVLVVLAVAVLVTSKGRFAILSPVYTCAVLASDACVNFILFSCFRVQKIAILAYGRGAVHTLCCLGPVSTALCESDQSLPRSRYRCAGIAQSRAEPVLAYGGKMVPSEFLPNIYAVVLAVLVRSEK